MGLRRTAVLARIWLRVAWLALRMYRWPLRSALAVHRLYALHHQLRRAWPMKLTFSSGRYFWDLYAPGWPSVAFDRYVEGELDRIDATRDSPPPLHAAIFAITGRCPLRCHHCAEWNDRNGTDELSSEDLIGIVRLLQGRGIAQLFLSGGEPLQRYKDVVALTKGIGRKVDVWVLSSGWGLTPARAAELRAAGLTGVILSLDHWDAPLHDEFRGTQGSFATVLRAAENVRREQMLLALSLCARRDLVSPDHLHRYARTAQSMGAAFLQILEPKPLGRYAGQDVTLDVAHQRDLERFVEWLAVGHDATDLPSAAYPDWYTRMHGCAFGGDRYLYVDAQGGLQSCPFCRAPDARRLVKDLAEGNTLPQVGTCPQKTRVGPPRPQPVPAHVRSALR